MKQHLLHTTQHVEQCSLSLRAQLTPPTPLCHTVCGSLAENQQQALTPPNRQPLVQAKGRKC
jgi:hypothetical protein